MRPRNEQVDFLTVLSLQLDGLGIASLLVDEVIEHERPARYLRLRDVLLVRELHQQSSCARVERNSRLRCHMLLPPECSLSRSPCPWWKGSRATGRTGAHSREIPHGCVPDPFIAIESMEKIRQN
jgi:hypothetical protein